MSSTCFARGSDRVIGPDGLDAELPTADIIVLATPLTSGTDTILTGAQMDCLPTGAIVVNVARSALLGETALTHRLERGSAGARDRRGEPLRNLVDKDAGY